MRPGAHVGDVAQRISALFAGRRTVFVLTNDEGRRYITGLLGQWFGLMNIQIVIAVVVAILGIFTTLTVSITDRRRELAVLQAVGGLRSQVRCTIWLEAIAVTLVGVALGVAMGAINLYFMLQVVQHDVAGFRFEYGFPYATAAMLLPILVTAGFVAAVWPAETAVRGSLVQALEYE